MPFKLCLHALNGQRGGKKLSGITDSSLTGPWFWFFDFLTNHVLFFIYVLNFIGGIPILYVLIIDIFFMLIFSKRLIKKVQRHLTILKNRREAIVRQSRADIGQFLQDRLLQKALERVCFCH